MEGPGFEPRAVSVARAVGVALALAVAASLLGAAGASGASAAAAAGVRAPAAGAEAGEAYALGRMAAEADAIAIGRVEGVETLARHGAWETRRAVVKVKEWIAGGPGARAWVTFAVEVDGMEAGAVTFVKGERVLVFLRRRLPGAPLSAGIAAAPPAPDPAHDYVVQVGGGARLGGRLGWGAHVEGVRADEPTGPAAVRRIVALHAPAPDVRGLRATLWTEPEAVRRGEGIPALATWRNVSGRPIRLETKGLLRDGLIVRAAAGRVGTRARGDVASGTASIESEDDGEPREAPILGGSEHELKEDEPRYDGRRAPVLPDEVVLAPGAEYAIALVLPVDAARRPEGDRAWASGRSGWPEWRARLAGEDLGGPVRVAVPFPPDLVGRARWAGGGVGCFLLAVRWVIADAPGTLGAPAERWSGVVTSNRVSVLVR
jgi:hypothetical protein